jgi:hypothetical protein
MRLWPFVYPLIPETKRTALPISAISNSQLFAQPCHAGLPKDISSTKKASLFSFETGTLVLFFIPHCQAVVACSRAQMVLYSTHRTIESKSLP